MSRNSIRTTAFVIAVLSLGVGATGSTSVLAKESHFRLAHRPAAAGYAGPARSFGRTYPRFVAGRGIVGEACDLPSSACSNNYRIND